MRVRVQVVIEPDDGGPAAVHEVAELERGALQIDTLGLQLAEAKELLRKVQEVVIEEQVRSCLAQQVPCPHCGRPRRHKDVDSIVAHAVRDAACGQPTQSVPAEPELRIGDLPGRLCKSNKGRIMVLIHS